MAETPILYDNFLKEVFLGIFDVSTDSLKAILCTASYTPNSETHTVLGDVTNQLSTGNGYTQNTKELENVTLNVSAGTVTIDCDDIEWEASGGPIGAARYLVIYDDDADDKLVAYVDFGANRIASDGSIFRIKINASGLLTVAQTT